MAAATTIDRTRRLQQLEHYLKRIGYSGSLAPTIETLYAIHRAHALSIAYENIDVLLEPPVDQDLQRIYNKLVGSMRGGWCYEMNGLLAWALQEVGFRVTRLVGGVLRVKLGNPALGNHLLLRVDLEQPILLDVGLGDGLIDPIELREGMFEQHGRRYRLERLTDDEFRFHNRSGGLPASFDLINKPADENIISRGSATLQTDIRSKHRRNLVVQRMRLDGLDHLLGKQLSATRIRNNQSLTSTRLLESSQDLSDTLASVFDIQIEAIDALWARVEARHAELFDA